MEETSTKRQCQHSDDVSVSVNISFPHVHSACMFKFEQMFKYIHHSFRDFHKLETIALFNRWLKAMNNRFVHVNSYFYLIECELLSYPSRTEYNQQVELICSVFVTLVAKLYMDDIVCKYSRKITSDYVNCLRTLYHSNVIKSHQYRTGFIFYIFDNNMQSALHMTRNDTVDRTPIYYYINVRHLIDEMIMIEKKVIKHLDWNLFNPIYLTLADQNDYKDFSTSQRKRPERHRKNSRTNYKRRPPNDPMGREKCIGKTDLLFSGEKRVCQSIQENQICCADISIESISI